MKFSQIVLIAILSFLVAFITGRYTTQGSPSSPPTTKESAYDRVMRTGTIRCGYYIFPPESIREPNTGKLSGFAIDLMKKIAATSGLKIEWTEEVDFGNWTVGLKAGRFDAACTPMWPSVSLAREASFTRPINYSGISVYARGDDHRFDNNLAAINDPSITIAVLDGDPGSDLAQAYFPKAQRQAISQTAPKGSLAENVITRKADILLWDENGVHDFLQSNPGALHNVDPSHPLRVMPFELAVALDEVKLRDFLDVGLQSLEDTGYTDQLLDKWERVPGSFYRLSKPYAVAPK